MRQNAIRLPLESDLGEPVAIDRRDAGPRESLRGRGRRRKSASPVGAEDLDQPPAGRVRECREIFWRARRQEFALRLAQQVAQAFHSPLQGPGFVRKSECRSSRAT